MVGPLGGVAVLESVIAPLGGAAVLESVGVHEGPCKDGWGSWEDAEKCAGGDLLLTPGVHWCDLQTARESQHPIGYFHFLPDGHVRCFSGACCFRFSTTLVSACTYRAPQWTSCMLPDLLLDLSSFCTLLGTTFL